MNTFIGGIAVGFVLFGVIASVIIFNRIQIEIARLAKETDSMNKALQMMFMKVNKIEKVTQETMNAAETFVDALRSSAEQMLIMRPGQLKNQMPPGGFDDIRKSFEEGIRRFEETESEEGDEDSDEENNEEPWKKK